MAKMSREEVEYGMKELITGVLIGFVFGFLIAIYVKCPKLFWVC